jgi:hypothetical protein
LNIGAVVSALTTGYITFCLLLKYQKSWGFFTVKKSTIKSTYNPTLVITVNQNKIRSFLAGTLFSVLIGSIDIPIRTPNMNPPIEPKMSGHISYDALQYFLYEVAEEAIIKIARTRRSNRLITTQNLAQRAWASEAYGTGLGRQIRTKVMPIMPPKSAKT